MVVSHSTQVTQAFTSLRIHRCIPFDIIQGLYGITMRRGTGASVGQFEVGEVELRPTYRRRVSTGSYQDISLWL